MKKIKPSLRYLFLSAILVFATTYAEDNANDIINKADDARTYDYVSTKGKMIVKDKFGTRTISMNTYSKGKTDMLIEFTSIEEKGQKVLRTAKEIYLYYPDAENLIRIQGAGMRDSMMGSDASYEDITRDKRTLDQYDATLLGKEDGAFKVQLIAKKDSKAAYNKQIWWIDPKTYLMTKGEYYSLSDKLLKKFTVLSLETVGGRPFISSMSLQNMLKKDTLTTVIYEKMSIDKIDDKKFSLNSLSF